MRTALVLSFYCALNVAAQPENAILEVDLSAWRTDIEGRIQAGPLPVDVQSDLGVKPRYQFSGQLRIQPSRRHGIRIEGSPLRLEGSNTLDRTIVYAGRSYPVQDTIDSKASLDYLFGGYQFNAIATDRGHLGLSAGAAYLHAEGTLTSVRTGLSASHTERLGMPLAGISARGWITRSIFLSGDVKGMQFGDYGHFVNARVIGGAALGPVGVHGGYQLWNANLHEKSGESGVDVRLKGPLFGVTFRWR